MEWVWEYAKQQGPLIVGLCLFSWLWLTGKIISAGELQRTENGHEREKKQLREERDHERAEKSEWKLMAHRGTDLAKFVEEKKAGS